jgi:pimeloyl-ACP methyl ester carboxylesterase
VADQCGPSCWNSDRRFARTPTYDRKEGSPILYRFGDFELDTAQRELRFDRLVRPLQPKVYIVLEYLLRHRERVVSKQEMLENLWPDVYVSEGSLQRAVSLVRSAIDDDGSRIRTVIGRGYRFIGHVDVQTDADPGALPFRPHFARSGDVHIAYHTVGKGEFDLIIVPGWVFPMRSFLDHPDVEAWVRGLSAYGRVVLFDKRGTGLSDRVKSLPTLEQRVDDLRAVLDAIGSRSALLIGLSEGGPLSIVFAASFPERVRGLLVAGSFARWSADPQYPSGWAPEAFDELRQYIASAWGSGKTIEAIVKSRAGDPSIAAWTARAEQEGASPGAALDLLEMNLRIDVRAILPTVGIPTVVLHSKQDDLFPVENARYLATHIPGARLVEVEEGDHAFLFKGGDALHEMVAWLLRQSAPTPARFLATILVLEADEGLDPAACESVVARHGGMATGVERTWRFDGPQRAMWCAHDLIAVPEARIHRTRAGVHVGEVSQVQKRLGGDGLETARAVAQKATPGEVWISRVVSDLIPGTNFTIEERGDVLLEGQRRIGAMASQPPSRISER